MITGKDASVCVVCGGLVTIEISNLAGEGSTIVRSSRCESCGHREEAYL